MNKKTEKHYPEPTIGAFIRNKKGEILLVKSFKWRKGRIWAVPGGRVELGESIGQAVTREVKEEVGLKIKYMGMFKVLESIYDKDFYKRKHFIFFECDCRLIDNQKVKIDNQEIQEAKWFGLKEALKLTNLQSYTRESVEFLAKK